MKALSICFYLKSVEGSNAPIMAKLSYGAKSHDLATGKIKNENPIVPTSIRIPKTEWINKKPVDKAVQEQLNTIADKIQTVYKRLSENSEQIDPKILKAEAVAELSTGKKVSKAVESIRLVDFIEQVLEVTIKNEATKNNYKAVKRKIIELEERLNRKVISNEFNLETYRQFISLCRETCEKHNGVWNYFKNLKATLNKIAEEYKVTVFNCVKDVPKSERLKLVTEEKVYLTFEDIKRVIDIRPMSEALENTRMILLTLLFTGCRYGDVKKIQPDFEYDKDGVKFKYARFITSKGNKEVIVPFLKPLTDMLERNGGKMPEICSEVHFNENVKELLRQCEITEERTVTYTDENGKMQFETKQFNEFVTSHCGRRSFVTNLINHVPIPMLAKITSHELKDSSVIFTYNKVRALENAVKFFQELKRLQEIAPEHFIFDLVERPQRAYAFEYAVNLRFRLAADDFDMITHYLTGHEQTAFETQPGGFWNVWMNRKNAVGLEFIDVVLSTQEIETVLKSFSFMDVRELNQPKVKQNKARLFEMLEQAQKAAMLRGVEMNDRNRRSAA